MSMLTMRATIVLIEFCFLLGASLQVPVVVVVHSSSIQVERKFLELKSPSSQTVNEIRGSLSPAMSLDGLTETVSVSQSAVESPAGSPKANNSENSSPAPTPPPPASTSSSTQDPNNHQDSDLDEPPPPQTAQDNSTNKTPTKDDPGGKNPNSTNGNRGNNSANAGGDNQSATGSERVSIELGVLWYSVFMVYVSFVKLTYHNVGLIRRNLTEPGILMIFGIIWELISRQLNSSLDVAPRFNSRIFFYLFLPSTVLESASILSNKWLLLNLLPILVHSIVGTLLYGSAIAFTIHAMSKQDLFNIGTSTYLAGGGPAATAATAETTSATAQAALWRDHWLAQANVTSRLTTSPSMTMMNDDSEESIFLYERSYVINAPMLDVGNLTLADCLVFGSIMSSLDSTTMLGVFSMYQVKEKLYYLVLGETLMNNAVVLIVFNLLLDFLNASRITIFKIYISIIQFFITLIGSIFVGLLLASVALLAVRLIKRFQVPSALTSYQNQCLAMIETLLVLKLAYLTYTLGGLAGLSSIVSLATFGVLQDQYIRLNLNLRSQLTFRQVVLATKTMGFSLVYPLLGMLLVDVAYASQYLHQQPLSASASAAMSITQTENQATAGATQAAASKLTSLAGQASSLLWNFKFLSLVTVISLAYRFGIVILLSLFCNLISSRKVKLRFREQLLLAYGGLKGPLAVALVHRLIEHDDHRDRLVMRNKHLFMYTILIMTLLSVVFKGALIRPLVEKMQIALHRPSASQKVVLFNAINTKVIERTTQAVSSLIGRSKSPYDRLFDFNETSIKPWLARDGSNTYWLSNLYDKLLLDEALDSSCFYKTAEESIAGSFWHSRVRQGSGELADRQPGNLRSQLDTIDEHGGGFIDDDELSAQNHHLSLGSSRRAPPNSQRGPRQLKARKTKNAGGQRKRSFTVQRVDRRNAMAGLKDHVMLDLELAAADGGREAVATEGRLNRVLPIGTEQFAGNNAKTVPTTTQLMLCSSSGGTEDSSKVRQRRQSSSDKEGYFSRLEKHLRASKSRAAGGSFTKNSNIQLPDPLDKTASAAREQPKLRLERRLDRAKRDKDSRLSRRRDHQKAVATTATRRIGPENDRRAPTSLSSE